MKQLLAYIVAILIWIAAAVLWAAGIPWLFAAFLILHLAELLLVGFRTGRKYGLGAAHSIAMCMLFGFLWWLPLLRAMRADELTDADFAEDGAEPWREKE